MNLQADTDDVTMSPLQPYSRVYLFHRDFHNFFGLPFLPFEGFPMLLL